LPDFTFLPGVSFFFVLGAIWGSFANVLILRIPQEKSIIPSSACPHCAQPIRWYQNVPIFSWLFLRGRCASCRKNISPQYFIVEVIMAVLFALAYVQFGWSWFLLEILIFIFGSVTASFIDLEHYILPDVFTLGGLAIGLLGAALNPERSFWSALIGFLVGGGFLYLTAYVHYLVRRIEGMGGGDIKLVAWIGAVLGWQSLLFVFLFASVSGAIVGLSVSAFSKRSLKEPIPFGPFLTGAALIYALADGPGLVQWFFSF
jgi:leader peptidase (prepilin peptidase) / N-methyltransferase